MKNKDFESEKDLILFEKEAKMEALKYIRETEKLKHEWELERIRIKTAEIRKSQLRSSALREER